MSDESLDLHHNSEDSQGVKAVPTDNNNEDEHAKVQIAGRNQLADAQVKVKAGRRNELADAQVGGKNGLVSKLVANSNQISSTRKYIVVLFLIRIRFLNFCFLIFSVVLKC